MLIRTSVKHFLKPRFLEVSIHSLHPWMDFNFSLLLIRVSFTEWELAISQRCFSVKTIQRPWSTLTSWEVSLTSSQHAQRMEPLDYGTQTTIQWQRDVQSWPRQAFILYALYLQMRSSFQDGLMGKSGHSRSKDLLLSGKLIMHIRTELLQSVSVITKSSSVREASKVKWEYGR